MKRSRLPKEPALLLDPQLVNLLRYYQILFEESCKPQKKVIVLSSIMGEMGDVEGMMTERLQWLFNNQYPRAKFIWGTIKSNKKLPDRMPKSDQRVATRYKERNGL